MISVVSPSTRFTWWPAATLSASAGVIARVALAWVGVAVTVVEDTSLAASPVYATVPAAKVSSRVTPLRLSADSVASVDSPDAERVTVTV